MPIRCSELLARLEDDDLLVVDCRDGASWESTLVHVPGALHLCLEELSQCAAELPEDELIVLVGGRRDGADARHARRLLEAHGRCAVCLDGGLQAWLAGGYPIEAHPCALPSGPLQR